MSVPQQDKKGAVSEALASLRSSMKWLYPGMRVKRWLFLVPLGIALVIVGVAILTNLRTFDYIKALDDLARMAFLRFGLELNLPKVYIPVSFAFMASGLGLIFISIRQIVGSIASAIGPERPGRLADVVFQKRYLSQGYRIVAIGGGTGLSTVLRGLKEYSSNLVAVVTVTDDGGSSGSLQRQYGMLPPGDIRNCLVALADAEPLMTELFQYRFKENTHAEQPQKGFQPKDDGSLEGHSFGNLLLAAMTHVTGGDFELAVKETSRVLAIRGRVLPSTVQHVGLMAEMDDGSVVEGETNILHYEGGIKNVYLKPSDVQPLQETLEAIRKADAIVIGPGSVFTSIIPNLLVAGVAEAIAQSKAIKMYVCNVMTQPGETDGYSASDHVRAIEKHSSHRLFDFVLINNQIPSEELLERYKETGAEPVILDIEKIRAMGYVPIISQQVSQTDVVRHDPGKLGSSISKVIFERGGSGRS